MVPSGRASIHFIKWMNNGRCSKELYRSWFKVSLQRSKAFTQLKGWDWEILLLHVWPSKIEALHKKSNVNYLTASIHLQRILSELLIKDEASIEWPWMVYSFSDFLLIQPLEQHNPLLSYFHPLLDSFLCLGTAWNQNFIIGKGRIFRLNSKFYFFEMWNEKPWSGNQLNHFERNFWLDYSFSF